MTCGGGEGSRTAATVATVVVLVVVVGAVDFIDVFERAGLRTLRKYNMCIHVLVYDTHTGDP